MNVPNISQGLGSATVPPRAGAGGEIAPPETTAAASAPVRTHAAAPAISLTRLACFDLKGDGHIDPRSVNDGGDATLLVPTHQVELPTWSYAVDSVTTPAPKAKPTGDAAGTRAASATPANAAQTNRAVGAYQRYGRTPAPAPSPDPTAAPVNPAATPAAAPVPVVTTPAAVGAPAVGPSAPGSGPTPAQTPAVAAA